MEIFTGYPQDLLQAARDILVEGMATATHKWIDQKRSPHLVALKHHPRRIINNDADKWLGIFSLHDFDGLSASPNEEDTYVLQGAGAGAVKALQVTLADDDYLYEEIDFSI